MEIVSQGNGYLMDISEAAENMNYVDKKQRVRRPFNADLSIGSHLTLKVSAYIYVSITFLWWMYLRSLKLKKKSYRDIFAKWRHY